MEITNVARDFDHKAGYVILDLEIGVEEQRRIVPTKGEMGSAAGTVLVLVAIMLEVGKCL